MDYCIETEELTKDFGDFRALDNLNLKIAPKGCIGYLGPNGSGKTTTMKILMNLIYPTKGNAYINGIDVQDDPKEALQRVGAIIGVPAFYKDLTARKFLSYVGELRGYHHDELAIRIKDVLDIVDLLGFIDTKIGKFSTGMTQRLAIAQAIFTEVDLLILDEPTFGIDPKGMASIRRLFKRIAKNKTIFISSHLLFEIDQICDKLVLLNYGKILAYDSIDKIKKKFKPNKVKVQLAKTIDNKILSEIIKLDHVIDIEYKNNQLFITFEEYKIEPYELLDSLHGLNLQINSFLPIEQSLESYYITKFNEEESNIGI